MLLQATKHSMKRCEKKLRRTYGRWATAIAEIAELTFLFSS